MPWFPKLVRRPSELALRAAARRAQPRGRRFALQALCSLLLAAPAAHAEMGSVTAEAALTGPTSPAPFVGLPPCRLVDTRPGQPSQLAGDDVGALAAGESRTYGVTGFCGIPAGAIAVSLNVTVVGTAGAGFLAIGPGGSFGTVTASTLNWTRSGEVIANAATVPLDTTGQVQVIVAAATHVLLDVNGFFAPTPGDGSAGVVRT